MKKQLILVLIAALIAAVWAGFTARNNLVTLDEKINTQYSQVQTQMQRRSDLIPNLVNTVKGYTNHEQAAIQAVADARAKLGGAQNVAQLDQANGELSNALGRLLMITENYPDLKADQNFRALQDELAGTENRIAVARKDYNTSVQEYNTEVRKFPMSIIASMSGFQPRDYFQADQKAQTAPEVKF
ncbi:MAG: LemA family protein [Veillonella sp.]|nr:LemA family protein [Veillonella sp.]MCF0155529.1 LemA family protein [Veillonella sp.]